MNNSKLSLGARIYLFIIVPITVIGWLMYGQDMVEVSCGILFTLMLLFPPLVLSKKDNEDLIRKRNSDFEDLIINNEL